MTVTTLAERMKRYEHVYRRTLPRRTYTLLRLDGKAFHSLTKTMDKPFDHSLVTAMDETMLALCQEVQGVQFAYTQSDEISLLLTDFANFDTEPWMGGVEAKMLSVSASIATGYFNMSLPTVKRPAHPAFFDSRVWTISDPAEVGNYFLWRQRDCIKNSITMVAQHHFSHSRLNGLNSNQRQELLWQEAGINWNDTPSGLKRGRVCRRTETNHWGVVSAPEFSFELLNDWVPKIGGSG